ncbi:MAG TPA: hypothetical protein PK406_14830 [Verrucomicrobiota bacterium]|nr:hypothetical protein [Verrucomicrobiota bacterium]
MATVLDLRQRSHIHFIAHSAGSQVIDTATTWLKIGGSSAPVIHETFLDAYDPRGQDSPYGLKAEWSDNYVDTQWVAPDGVDYTQLWLKGAYSIDVTPAFSISSCGYSIYPIIEPASVCAHAWPYRFYAQTTDNSSGIGFPLSLEKGQSLATLLARYPKGESCEIFGCEGGPRQTLAVAQQSVIEVFNRIPILSPTILEQSGTAQCASGTWLCDTVKLNTSTLNASPMQSSTAQAAGTTALTQDPAWLVVHILTNQPGNTLRFNWRFATGGEGLLRLFANEKLVREIDQRHVPAVSPQPESVYVGDLAPGTHKIAFRLDGYGTNPSGVELTGVELGQQALVVDTTPPTFTNVTASPSTLWPPNHKMVNITINAKVKDDSGLPVTLSAAVTSNEPQNGLGDGDTAPDWTTPVIKQDDTGVVTITLQLRAERSGSGNGRIYTVTITATDASGNTSTAPVNILVPHDKGK